MQVLYLPISGPIKKTVKILMDVTVERLGDAAAAVIILASVYFFQGIGVTSLSYVSISLLLVWIAIVFIAHKG